MKKIKTFNIWGFPGSFSDAEAWRPKPKWGPSKQDRQSPKEKRWPLKENPPKEEPPPKAEPTFPDLATVNAARAFWETRAHTRRHARQNEIPSRCFATIDNSEDGDVYFLNYFEQHDTFSGAEFYIKQEEFNPDWLWGMLSQGPCCCRAAAEEVVEKSTCI